MSERLVAQARAKRLELGKDRALAFATVYNKIYSRRYDRVMMVLGKYKPTESKFFPLMVEHSDWCFRNGVTADLYLRAQFDLWDKSVADVPTFREYKVYPRVNNILNFVSEARFHKFVKDFEETRGKKPLLTHTMSETEAMVKSMRRSHEQVLYWMHLRKTVDEGDQFSIVLANVNSLSPFYLLAYQGIRQPIADEWAMSSAWSKDTIIALQKTYNKLVENDYLRKIWTAEVGALNNVR